MLNFYLSGAITAQTKQLEEDNRQGFIRDALRLRQAGYSIVNPIDMDHVGPVPNRWEDYLRRDIMQMLSNCSAIVTRPGWIESQGAKLEVNIARALEWPVYTVDYLLSHATTYVTRVRGEGEHHYLPPRMNSIGGVSEELVK